jgi:hypothetical protein
MPRRFTLDFERNIAREREGCKAPGAICAVLRPEGLYSSYLTDHAGSTDVPLWLEQPRSSPS